MAKNKCNKDKHVVGFTCSGCLQNLPIRLEDFNKHVRNCGMGQLMRMTMMTPPNLNDDLHYLNKEDRLLRWILVKHRDIKYGLESLSEDNGKSEQRKFLSKLFDEDIDENDDEYELEQEERKDD